MERSNTRIGEEAYCPICGNNFFDIRGTNNPGVDKFHRCPESKLRAINAAQTRALRENNLIADLHENCFAQQLHDGFAMLNAYELEDDGLYVNNCKEA